ncbi:MAG: hypothetical protein HS111_15725 [Kofleriaceae bacterium]|nr:hypothetical protein [Kofleriaceae bacterium]
MPSRARWIPAAGAQWCARVAAVALLIGGFSPWFSTGDGDGDDGERRRGRRAYTYVDVDELVDDDSTATRGPGALLPPTSAWSAPRPAVTSSARPCASPRAPASLTTPSPGSAAARWGPRWPGRAPGGGRAGGACQRRPILRGWAATVAAAAAGLGGAFAASWALEAAVGPVDRSIGLLALVLGGALAGAGAPPGRGATPRAARAPLPAGRRDRRAHRARLGHAGRDACLAARSGHTSTCSGSRSPLGVEVCDGDCRLATALRVTTGQRLLATLTALLTAALVVPAAGAVVRLARASRPAPGRGDRGARARRARRRRRHLGHPTRQRRHARRLGPAGRSGSPSPASPASPSPAP